MLPETYSNIGKPTRLIIYCHGAGVNYQSTVTGFPASDCDPDYWLAEGCAVMDIEGNPYNNSDEHGYIPEARQSYMAAYNWIINNYNICRDGIFLGGRSMGGGMTFEVLQSTIPVIAACPVVPVCNQLWWWNYMSNARRKFCAEKMGFTGTTPTWGADGKTLSDEEKQYLYDNFDKMVKYSPLWRGIENLPDKDTLFAHAQISSTATSNEAEAAMYAKLRFKVKAPVKIFASKEDNTVPYTRNAVYMYNMLKNAAQPCELRVFSTNASSAHHFEQQDSRAYTTVTTVYGKTMSAPLVYIEMMQFWRRYEKTI
jgi:dipeptidyl aminopeptidase/acylaminoacyl peptidase